MKKRLGHRYIGGKPCEDIEERQENERSLKRNQHCHQLDLELIVSRTVMKISVESQVCGTSLGTTNKLQIGFAKHQWWNTMA